jgi:hypothetical protein
MEIDKLLIIELLRSDGYLVVNKRLLSKIGLVNAVVLSNYIDKYQYFKEHYAEFDDWFFLTHSQQCEQLGLTQYAVRDSKHFLIEHKLLLSKRKGNPAKEYFKINFRSIYSLLFKDTPRESDLPNSGGQVITNSVGQVITNSGGLYYNSYNIKETLSHIEKIKKVDTPIKERKSRVTPIKERNKDYTPYAEYLSKIIRTNKNITHTPQQLTMWSNEFRRLAENNKISHQRIQDALDWYAQNIGGEYIPVIESGNAFRHKFLKIESAISRCKKPKKEDIMFSDGIKYIKHADGHWYHARTGTIFFP